MSSLAYRVRYWLTRVFLGLAVWAAPEDVKAERDRLHSHRRI